MNFQWLLGKSVAKNMVSYSRLEQNPDNDPDDSEDNSKFISYFIILISIYIYISKL